MEAKHYQHLSSSTVMVYDTKIFPFLSKLPSMGESKMDLFFLEQAVAMAAEEV
jgi:hypothetical protein